MIREDRRSFFLLLSLLLTLLLSAFINEGRSLGGVLFLLSMYVSLVAAALELSQKKSLRWPAILLAGCSMLMMLAHFLHPVRALLLANWMLLAVFLGFVSVALFLYLGRPGSITSGRIYASVSLYLMIGFFYYAVFNWLESIHTGSFLEAGAAASGGVTRHALLYLSLVTLTTLGYGDVLPVSPPARTFAALEAMTGVLYIAITVARLVASYQRSSAE